MVETIRALEGAPAHSDQVPELLLGTRGLTLTDVCAAGGAAFMGTLRLALELGE